MMDTTDDLEAPLLSEFEKKQKIDFDRELDVCTAVVYNDTSIIEQDQKESKDDDDDDDTVFMDTETTVIDAGAECNLLNGTYLIGFGIGFLLQGSSMYTLGWMLKSEGTDAGVVVVQDDTATATATAAVLHPFGINLLLFLVTRYWVPVALMLPPIVAAVIHKVSRRRRRQRQLHFRRSIDINGDHEEEDEDDDNAKKKKGTTCIEIFFECIRFQFGLFFGSLILLSIVNTYELAKTAPLVTLGLYYGVCFLVSFVGLCLLQFFINQVCASISTVKIVVSYDDDDDDDYETDNEDEDDDDDYETDNEDGDEDEEQVIAIAN